jgi:leucine dehydrogenase
MNTTFHDELLRYAESLGFGDLHIKLDPATDLCAIVAIHSTKRGPALGGCRLMEYDSVAEAVRDGLRLARGMSYKAAICNLALGGGKSVIIKPKQIKDRNAFFAAFGRFVHELGGRYITAIDSGTDMLDMDVINTQTPYVTTISKHNGNPAPFTATGVRVGIQAAVQFKLGKTSLDNIHVAIQGAGHVGYLLAKELTELGARITMCDKNTENLQRCVQEFNVQPVALNEIYGIACDVFAPCAVGGILNDQTIAQLKTSIIAGSANNQLDEAQHGRMLHEHHILYAPDYLINAGGLIHAYAEYHNTSFAQAEQHILHIGDQLIEIFERSAQENKPTCEIADAIAAGRL